MRVIKCGDNEIVLKCRCGCEFAFNESEIIEDNTGRFWGRKGKPLRFVICPQCRHCIALN